VHAAATQLVSSLVLNMQDNKGRNWKGGDSQGLEVVSFVDERKD